MDSSVYILSINGILILYTVCGWLAVHYQAVIRTNADQDKMALKKMERWDEVFESKNFEHGTDEKQCNNRPNDILKKKEVEKSCQAERIWSCGEQI